MIGLGYKELVDVPLVLHGSSGVPEESLRRAISLGISKINIDTDVGATFTKRSKGILIRKPDEIDPERS